jgi:DNA processing protein
LVIEAKEKSGSLITANYAIKQNKKLFAVPGQIYSQNSAGPNKLIKNGAKLITSTTDVLEELGISTKVSASVESYGATMEEKLIINALRDEPLHVDKIIEITKLNASAVATSLALMEISDKIRRLGGNIYSLN